MTGTERDMFQRERGRKARLGTDNGDESRDRLANLVQECVSESEGSCKNMSTHLLYAIKIFVE